ncbi:hypothetical protein [Filomicrobium sp.]|uniref:hypothetical protein n=1 Tax=Filomicrobium sp. TaxID=2024831 RepID=UPI00259057AF|nr:hypothetical protein [Filomicrobium sp.]MCV0371724.1 hypothetical protein [Filomicrobium sp.]
MATNTVGTNAREYPQQMVHYLRKSVAFDTNGIATGVKMGTIPVGAQILNLTANVSTGFNSAGTNRLVVGTNSTSFNNIATSTTLAASTAGAKVSTIGGALSFTQDTDVYVKYTAATGTAADAGAATLVLSYVPDNDG